MSKILKLTYGCIDSFLVHLGVCQADTDCASYHHPPGPLHCGCPDCSKPHPPHFQNSYCENLVTSESATDTSAADESDSSAGGSQKASRKFSLVMLVGAAAVLSFIAAAAVMHKRVSWYPSNHLPYLTTWTKQIGGFD